MVRILITNFLIILAAHAFGQVELGKKAPMIPITEWIDNPHFESQKIEGKAIVLDFWFTSCAPCIYTIPHLNDLSEKYKNDSIVFISISFETKEVLQKFLSKKRILSNIASDTSNSIINAFEVSAYPMTFLIDKNGILKWKGYPSHLNSEIIDALLDNKFYPELTVNSNLKLQSKSEFSIDQTLPITVSKNNYMDGGSGMQYNQNELSIVNQTLPQVMSNLLNISQNRIATSDKDRYDIRFKIPEDLAEDRIIDEITKSLLDELALTAESKTLQVNGFELHIDNDSLFAHNAINSSKVYYGIGTSTNKDFWIANGAQIEHLTKELENRFGSYVIDKTNLFGYFEFKLPIASFDLARKYLLQTYGLDLISTQVTVEITELKNKYDKH